MLNYILCPTCQGLIAKREKICPTCHGRGLYAWYGGYLLFFTKRFRFSYILTEKIRKIFQILINLFLIVFGILGLVAVLENFLDFKFLSNKFLVPNKLMLFFWWSVLADFYFYYRYAKSHLEIRKVWPKTARKSLYLPTKWEEIVGLNNSLKINVFQALSPAAKNLLNKAWLIKRKLKQEKLTPIHLLSALISYPDVILAINRLGLNWEILKKKISLSLKELPDEELELKKILLEAYAISGEKEKIDIGPLELLEALSAVENRSQEIFYDLEIKQNEIKNVSLWIDIYEELSKQSKRFARKALFKPKGAVNRAMTARATPTLDFFSQDLTFFAREGRLSLCINRKKELENIFRILETGKKSVILVGQPGVGKTTIINGISRAMTEEDVPSSLKDKRLVSLNLSSLVSGASRPGEIEQRLQMIMKEIVESGNIIIFIKNIHNMVGVKTTEGQLDISEILADGLKKGLFMILATSTPSEFQKFIEGKDLGEVLSKIEINEPEENETIQILEANIASIEAQTEVYFSYPALSSAVNLSKRYLYERYLPEKAINLLSEAATYVKNKSGKGTIIKAEDVAELISEKTKIPLTKITEKESEKLLSLEEEIHQRIIDQEEAVKMVSSAIRRARAELRDIKRPIVNLLFLGPTGVGKTELAKTVAQVYFGDEKNMTRLDMSEYQEKESLSRLIGTPENPGYLTEAVRKQSFTLLLLDEIEKAHPDILNIFLQVMDDGRLTDGMGRTIDFTNVILIGTSNAGTDFIQQEMRKGKPILEIQKVLVQEKLGAYFRPEFLNRFDGVIVFKPLSKEEIFQIAKLILTKLSKQLETKGVIFKATDEAIKELAEDGFDPTFGARPLKRVIQEKVNNALANYFLEGKLSRRDIAILEKGGIIKIEKAQKI